MKRTAQVIDRFESRGKLVLTLWDLKTSRRFTIRISGNADVRVGELLDVRDRAPRLLRIRKEAIDRETEKAAILPIRYRGGAEERTDGYAQRYA